MLDHWSRPDSGLDWRDVLTSRNAQLFRMSAASLKDRALGRVQPSPVQVYATFVSLFSFSRVVTLFASHFELDFLF
jgi:hypothetical protein